MINSLDAITMLPRTAEAADIQGRENQLMEHAALQPGSQFQEKVKRNQRQAVETQNSEKMNKDGGSGKGDRHDGMKKRKTTTKNRCQYMKYIWGHGKKTL